MGTIHLGCIADDFTGATDLANNLVRGGMRVVQTMGVPRGPLAADVDAVVIALKSRTIAAADAAAQSVQALHWLQAQGARQFYFKYCSTFDSTPAGNIGPVTDALMDALGTDFTIACPAFPENGRTVFKGYLFAGDVLLQESGMRSHPLTPMTDSNLVRVLQQQTARRVGLVDYSVVRRGADAIRQRMAQLRGEGVQMVIVDAMDNADLMALGLALADLPRVTAGSGVAIGLPQNYGVRPGQGASCLPSARGARAIVSGSCSVATNGQVADFRQRGGPAFAIDPLRLIEGADLVQEALAWAGPRLGAEPVLIYATAEPDAVRAVQAQVGAERAGGIVEAALSAIARGLVERGAGQLIVAGGETAGACVQALEVDRMRIGPQIAPGVPWCHAQSPFAAAQGVHLALKSGNFGSADFFTRAFALLQPPASP
ncbi:3-oxo-tetronate kinase [Xylophilus sp.]|uniref:3-oxo-tetronate kinase n=1 Tax=Xylophilus sp. TaxID=2653893 RepID=UPI0013BA6AE6|nr:3-oxo-tetronate kinase [Xylophilus sp.]KAF1050281.1 MAG: 3-oxo-tetronate kinase [Xylophilus sp.]